jgi:hypothetical protein
LVRTVILLVAVALLAVVPAVPALAACSNGQSAANVCTSGAINGGAVDVSASTGHPGSGGTGHNGTGHNSGNGTSAPPIIWKCLEVTCASDAPGAAPITLSDIATFRPTPGTQFMQPDGWVVPGLDANFIAVTGPHIVNGTLLGQPASVRFTPIAFHWSYGDGQTANRSTKGATWQALGVAEFSPTSTSHVYDAEGTYTIRLTIDFAAEYRFAGSAFVPIAGVIPLPANELHVTVDGAKTVLVEHDCAVNPAGPGC